MSLSLYIYILYLLYMLYIYIYIFLCINTSLSLNISLYTTRVAGQSCDIEVRAASRTRKDTSLMWQIRVTMCQQTRLNIGKTSRLVQSQLTSHEPNNVLLYIYIYIHTQIYTSLSLSIYIYIYQVVTSAMDMSLQRQTMFKTHATVAQRCIWSMRRPKR